MAVETSDANYAHIADPLGGHPCTFVGYLSPQVASQLMSPFRIETDDLSTYIRVGNESSNKLRGWLRDGSNTILDDDTDYTTGVWYPVAFVVPASGTISFHVWASLNGVRRTFTSSVNRAYPAAATLRVGLTGHPSTRFYRLAELAILNRLANTTELDEWAKGYRTRDFFDVADMVWSARLDTAFNEADDIGGTMTVVGTPAAVAGPEFLEMPVSSVSQNKMHLSLGLSI